MSALCCHSSLLQSWVTRIDRESPPCGLEGCSPEGDARDGPAEAWAREKGPMGASQLPLELAVRVKADTCEVDTGDGQGRAMVGASVDCLLGRCHVGALEVCGEAGFRQPDLKKPRLQEERLRMAPTSRRMLSS